MVHIIEIREVLFVCTEDEVTAVVTVRRILVDD